MTAPHWIVRSVLSYAEVLNRVVPNCSLRFFPFVSQPALLGVTYATSLILVSRSLPHSPCHLVCLLFILCGLVQFCSLCNHNWARTPSYSAATESLSDLQFGIDDSRADCDWDGARSLRTSIHVFRATDLCCCALLNDRNGSRF